ncbi:MAG: translesion DNA synthesis-associated protein ImuA [Pseudomonadota bacterium]
MQPTLEKLLQQRALWRCSRDSLDGQTAASLSTGYTALDQALPHAGWPRDTLIEVLSDTVGVGELRLLMPALAALLAERDGYIVWVGSPYQAYAPALLQWGIDVERVLLVEASTASDVVWACGEALSSGSAVAVLGWVGSLDITATRRLKLAAADSHSLAVLLRPLAARAQSSAASLRLAMVPGSGGTGVDIFKVSGGRPQRIPAFESLSPFWPALTKPPNAAASPD